MSRSTPLLLASVVALSACGGDEVTVVVVTVQARPSVEAFDELHITASNGAASIQTTFSVSGRDLPLSFSITPEGRDGVLVVDARGEDAQGILRGIGRAQTTIATGARVDLELQLDPADFVVNSSIAGNQRLTFVNEGAGRQLAAGPDGSLLAGFVNDCATLGRCDIFARRFDADGRPLTNGISMDSGEFIANLSDEIGDVTAVAVGPTGMYLAWETFTDVRGVALDANGAHLGFAETVLSNSDEFPGSTSLATLGSGDYLAVWGQGFTGEIRGRLIGADGVPRTNPVTNDALDFPISTIASSDGRVPSVAPTGTGQGFVAAWRTASDVRGRFFDSTGAPLSASEVSLANYASGARVFGPQVAWSGGAAMVAWGVRDASTPGLERGAFALQSFDPPNGAAAGPVAYLSQSTPDISSVPDIAALPNGLVGVAWHNCTSDGDGSGCGVFFQLVRPTGLPIGEPTIVNTTTLNDQVGPSIAAVGAGSFAIVWTDGSQTEPDTSQTAIRGRLIYPDLAPTDGRRGAPCGTQQTAACAEGLTCMAGSDNAPHCHRTCDPGAPAPQCPEGGACTTMGADSACLF
ncbi:MAG TPA: hypothetical protein VML75_14030 [Kofleriaceae bacterium]|nr:hypothetical protein [Kofleriaceae bacterium]